MANHCVLLLFTFCTSFLTFWETISLKTSDKCWGNHCNADTSSHPFILYSAETSEATTPVNTQWPDIEDVRKLPFDPNPRDPKFRKASPVYSDKMPKCFKGKKIYMQTHNLQTQNLTLLCALVNTTWVLIKHIYFNVFAEFKQEGESQTQVKRVTKSMRLSRFAAHNAFHHCEQCHQYCEAGPATQVSYSLHTYVRHLRLSVVAISYNSLLSKYWYFIA